MSDSRRFFDWNEPFLPQVADSLVERNRRRTQLDLSKVAVVLPGGRAGRRLLELLVLESENERLAFSPPQFLTPGRLSDFFKPIAAQDDKIWISDSVSELLWTRAVSDRRELLREVYPLLTFSLESDETIDEELRTFGNSLMALDRELSGWTLSFEDVSIENRSFLDADGANRWKNFAAIHDRYLALVDGHGFRDRSEWLRSFNSIEDLQPCSFDSIVVAGVPELNGAQSKLLDLLAESVVVEYWIFAPKEERDRFHRQGTVLTEAWSERPILIDDDRIHIVENSFEEIGCAIRSIELDASDYASEDVVVGVNDKTIVPELQARLLGVGVASRYAESRPIKRTIPYKVLEATAKLLGDPNHTALSKWLRIPALEIPIRKKVDSIETAYAIAKRQSDRLADRIRIPQPDDELDSLYNKTILAVCELLDAFAYKSNDTNERKDRITGNRKAEERNVEEPGVREKVELDKVSRRRLHISKWASAIRLFLINVFEDRENSNTEDDNGDLMDDARKDLGEFAKAIGTGTAGNVYDTRKRGVRRDCVRSDRLAFGTSARKTYSAAAKPGSGRDTRLVGTGAGR